MSLGTGWVLLQKYSLVILDLKEDKTVTASCRNLHGPIMMLTLYDTWSHVVTAVLMYY